MRRFLLCLTFLELVNFPCLCSRTVKSCFLPLTVTATILPPTLPTIPRPPCRTSAAVPRACRFKQASATERRGGAGKCVTGARGAPRGHVVPFSATCWNCSPVRSRRQPAGRAPCLKEGTERQTWSGACGEPRAPRAADGNRLSRTVDAAGEAPRSSSSLLFHFRGSCFTLLRVMRAAQRQFSRIYTRRCCA